MFVEYDNDIESKEPFILNILMDVAEEDLYGILKKGDFKPMGL